MNRTLCAPNLAVLPSPLVIHSVPLSLSLSPQVLGAIRDMNLGWPSLPSVSPSDRSDLAWQIIKNRTDWLAGCRCRGQPAQKLSLRLLVRSPDEGGRPRLLKTGPARVRHLHFILGEPGKSSQIVVSPGRLILYTFLYLFRDTQHLQGSAKEWFVGCVNPAPVFF